MKRLSFTGLTLVLLLAACGPTLKVTSDYDRQANFAPYKTFAFYNPAGEKSSISELNRNRIQNAVIDQMKAKGYTEADTASADLLVNTITVAKEGKSVTANTDYYGYGGMYRPYGYWGGGMGMATSTTNYSVDKYIDGSVIVDVIDRNKRHLVWQGVGNSQIDSPLKDPDTQIPKAIAKIMSSFPSKQ
ncbi:DUF4136 domain-containing protein [Chitinophaga barathri]|uniref:DUF4136 domain-containing protein n=1 Tax=Chitinophaga barathri TaxID=1647451 RepID=A0A3N4M6Q0_9BACT|nr:DUF4136 domain-containing protein [Chitinophaga barathri]RPD39022.1 DUF4136 domain-containing protein [Chitinophaga barathri]